MTSLVACVVRESPNLRLPLNLPSLSNLARLFSPRIAPWLDAAVVFDASGLDRAIGPPDRIASEVCRIAAEQGMAVRVAIAGRLTTAWTLAHARRGVSIARPGEEAATLASLPLDSLRSLGAGPLDSLRSLGLRFAPDLECLEILRRWGLTTLGDLARLPRGEVHARLGPDGVRLHQVASGEDECPLAPVDEPTRFHERSELEWPIDSLEPLAFVLSRLCDALEGRLARADRGAVAITTRLRLVTKTAHERTLHVPAPMRDARVIRTLILLDLESHPPGAGIDVVEIDLDVAPGRIVSGALFDLTLPSPEDVATLVARLSALVGEARVGAPVLVDTFDTRARALAPFVVRDARPASGSVRDSDSRTDPGRLSVRRLPLPVAARVTLEHGRPARVQPSARGLVGGPVTQCAGPWRSSGAWWTLDRRAWDRDEWDVELPGAVYRLAHDRASGSWSIDAVVD